MFKKRDNMTGEELHAVDRLAEFQRAKRVYVASQAILNESQQIAKKAKAAFEQASRELEKVAHSE